MLGNSSNKVRGLRHRHLPRGHRVLRPVAQLSVGLVLIGGIANLAFLFITQTVVQLLAPPRTRARHRAERGVGRRPADGQRVHDGPARRGDRVRWSLEFSAAALFIGTMAAGL
jgi:hypothetical protein